MDRFGLIFVQKLSVYRVTQVAQFHIKTLCMKNEFFVSEPKIHVLYESFLEFIKNPENIKAYERWIKDEKRNIDEQKEGT